MMPVVHCWVLQPFTTGAGEKAVWGRRSDGKDSITASAEQKTAFREKQLHGWQQDLGNWDANDTKDKQVIPHSVFLI